MEVLLDLDAMGEGLFYINDDLKRLGTMKVSVNENELKVYHTEVIPEAEGKGVAKQLLSRMVEYAREKKYTVVPLCPYVHAQFIRHKADYADLWQPGNPLQSV